MSTIYFESNGIDLGKIDWQKLALNLRNYGALSTLSKKLGRYPGYLNEMSKGGISEPKFNDAVELLFIYCGVSDLFGLEKLYLTKIDWQQMALNLRRYSPLCTLSGLVGRDEGYLNQIARGDINQPKFSDGVKILLLYKQAIGLENHKQLPRR